MISFHTYLTVADNSGARTVQCIGIPGNTKKKTATIGDTIIVVIKKCKPNKKVKKGEVMRGIIIRVKKKLLRLDGTTLEMNENSIILLGTNNQPIGTRIFGPIPYELRQEKYNKIISLASFIV
jgi:large subunit ribosomal protein L14